jgi:hypothetical protein
LCKPKKFAMVEKVTIVNKAGIPMKVPATLAEKLGIKQKPKVLAKPPELIEVIKPVVANIEPVKVEVQPIVEAIVEPLEEPTQKTAPKKRRR